MEWLDQFSNGNELASIGFAALAALIGAAILIFGWRLLNGTGKTVIIVIALAFFVAFAVIPNWNG